MKKEFRDYLKSMGRKDFPGVLLASAECAPLSKTGGLADVVGTLPKSFKAMGIDARVITPYHRCIKNKYADKVEHMFYFYVQLGWRREYAGIEKLEIDARFQAHRHGFLPGLGHKMVVVQALHRPHI